METPAKGLNILDPKEIASFLSVNSFPMYIIVKGNFFAKEF